MIDDGTSIHRGAKRPNENESNTADLEFGLQHANPRIDPSGQACLYRRRKQA